MAINAWYCYCNPFLCCYLQVKLEFSADRELPGGEASFRLESQPGSLCSVRAVDQSILLLQPDQELSASYVRSHTLTKDIDSIPGQPVMMTQLKG